MMLSDPQQLSVALTSIEDVAKNATAMMVLIDIEFFKALMWLLKKLCGTGAVATKQS